MIFLSMVLLVSVIYSKYVLSLSMFGFFFLALTYAGGSFKWWKNRSFLLVTLLFFLFVISGINSSNIGEWVHHLKMRLPFLAFPLVFYKLPAWNKKELMGLHVFFIGILFLSSIPVLYYILANFDVVFQDIARGRPIETPVNHVKYSIFIAYGIISGLIIFFKGYVVKYRWEKKLLLLLVVYLTVFLHILAVRSGIAVLYICVFLLGMIYSYRSGSIRAMGATLIILILIPLAAFNFIPSLNKRIHYMVYDFNEFRKDGGDNYSDSDRINSLKVGLFLFRHNPLMGTGVGDIRDECEMQYLKSFGKDKRVLYPHNQYLFIAASTGVLGLFLFLAGLWGPLIINHNYKDYLLLMLILMFSTGFMVDNLMERSFSAAFFAFFLTSFLSLRKSIPSQ